MQVKQKRPAIVWIAIIAASLLTGLWLISATLNNPVISIPNAIVAACAAIGLIRGERWAGFGLALFLVCSTAAAIYATASIGSLENTSVLVGSIVPLVIAALAYLAAKESPRPGHRWPWVVASAAPIALGLFFNLMFMPTGSMEPTLLMGDTLVVKRTGPAALGRGELVVYREPGKQNVWVKRIVGVGGDRLHFDHKRLLLNGRPVDEPYALHKTDFIDTYRDNFPSGDMNFPLPPKMQQELRQQVRDGDFVVPAGTYFVLGDNRDNSLDSRYSGVIPVSAVIGKPWIVCFSAQTPSQPRPHNVLACARWNRLLKRL
jgi:signal peptidase I